MCIRDRYWLVADGQITAYEGDLDSYQQQLQQMVQQQAKSRQQENKANRQTNGDSRLTAQDRKQQKREEAAQRAQLRPLKKQLAALEEKLDKSQTLMAELEQQLTDPNLYTDEKQQLRTLLDSQAKATQEAAELEEKWLLCQEQLEQLESQLGL